MVNYKGNMCKLPLMTENLLPKTFGSMVSGIGVNHGILFCGGEENIWEGPDLATLGGNVGYKN